MQKGPQQKITGKALPAPRCCGIFWPLATNLRLLCAVAAVRSAHGRSQGSPCSVRVRRQGKAVRDGGEICERFNRRVSALLVGKQESVGVAQRTCHHVMMDVCSHNRSARNLFCTLAAQQAGPIESRCPGRALDDDVGDNGLFSVDTACTTLVTRDFAQP